MVSFFPLGLVKIILTKTCISIHITNSSVNFTLFAFLSHQKFHERPLFKSATLFDLPPFWIVSKQILIWDSNNFCYKPIPNNVELTFMGKKFLEIQFILLFKKIPIIYWMILYIYIYIYIYITEGICDVTDAIIENGYSNARSNTDLGCLHFT